MRCRAKAVYLVPVYPTAPPTGNHVRKNRAMQTPPGKHDLRVLIVNRADHINQGYLCPETSTVDHFEDLICPTCVSFVPQKNASGRRWRGGCFFLSLRLFCRARLLRRLLTEDCYPKNLDKVHPQKPVLRRDSWEMGTGTETSTKPQGGRGGS